MRRAHPTPAPTLVALVLLVLALLPATLGFASDLSALRPIPVLEGGRVKPVDTMAREAVRVMTGRERFQGRDPLEVALDIAADPGGWETRPVVHIPLIEWRGKLALAGDAQHVAPRELRRSVEYQRVLAAALGKRAAAKALGEDPDFTRLELTALEISDRLAAFDSLATSRRFMLLPGAADADAWRSPPELPPGHPIRTAWAALTATHAHGTPAAADTTPRQSAPATGPATQPDMSQATGTDAVGALLAALPESSRALMPDLAWEVRYHAVHPFRWAWGVYLLSLLVLCLSAMSARAWPYRLGVGLLWAGIAWSAFAFAWRCSVTGWAPVTNIYETVVWVGLVAAVVAAVIAARAGRCAGGRAVAIAGSISATIAGLVADVMPPEYGSAIKTLAPVLRSNLWLTVHVLTIVSSYAAFLVALVLGNFAVALYAFRPGSPAIAQHLKHLYRAVQVGVLLIAAGTILGGLWADVSWGRFWGWDPKEVWALIVLLTYLALLHGRFAGWVGGFGLAAGAVLCFLTVLMSWYGVNFLLGAGLHSYGFGTGGQAYVGTYTLAQLLFVAVCYTLHRRTTKPSATPAAA